MTELDMSALDEVTGPSDDQLKTIVNLAKRQIAAELQVEQLKAELQKAEFRIIDELFIGLDDESVSQLVGQSVR